MNKHDFYELARRIVLTISLLTFFGFILDRQHSMVHELGRAAFMGTVLAVLFYAIDRWRDNRRKNLG